ncbi:ribonuclease J [Auraticoccus monumenti]|uniref:Ribonuclease J n=1 Tax=Auraticoccus monumenti TaxID=675864 RepID=A0A1G6VP97_9ACTN|nr:ribonuclease J [Auraticoccus monumenti]SDD55418.1 ribonuclease J [Auraticoccus monumenti]
MTRSTTHNRPPKLPQDGLRVVALGGLGEIGRNMTVLEHRGELLVIDCGVLFPENHQPGVDVILPDFTWIRERLDRIKAIVLTHGHEDHIGAVPYLLRERPDIPVIGSRLTLAFLAAKMQEHRLSPTLVEVVAGERRDVGVFDLEFVAVNHSIPDGLAIAVRTSAGLLLHTGDFKMDQFPLDRRITDLRAFSRLGVEGVDLFLTDSTNATVPGFTTAEHELTPAIETVFRTSPKRIIVSSFASHVHRIQQVLNAAHSSGRKVALVGRSMVRNMGIAQDLGYLEVPEGLIVDLKQLARLPDNRITLICTGSQGEPMAALARMAKEEHKIRVGDGDTVLLASSLIPGNESAVYGLINGLARLGANVVHSGNAKVHVSGHASAGELVYCYNIVQPRHVMPVHGEWRHLHANGVLATRTGVPEDRVLVGEDGMVVDLVRGRAKIVGSVPAAYVYVEGGTVGRATETTLEERRALSGEGTITIVAIMNMSTGEMSEDPDFIAHGLTHDRSDLRAMIPALQEDLRSAAQRRDFDPQAAEATLARTAARWLQRRWNRSPVIVPVVVEE